MQNTAAHITTLARKFDHIFPVLASLHWLPVRQRIEFKVLILTFKAQHQMAPSYLCDLLQVHHPSRSLRSSSQHQLVVPRTKTTTYGRRAFSVAAPSLWNSLPMSLRECHEFTTFKSLLKTHLFKNAFNVKYLVQLSSHSCSIIIMYYLYFS